jgi:hypothetical protein
VGVGLDVRLLAVAGEDVVRGDVDDARAGGQRRARDVAGARAVHGEASGSSSSARSTCV